MTFGKSLLEFRAKHDLTQANLADFLGITPYMVHRYEKGKSNPSAKNEIIYLRKMKEMEEK